MNRSCLENAGEGSVLPMLRSVRLLLDRFALGHKGSGASSSDGIDVQVTYNDDEEIIGIFFVAVLITIKLLSDMMWHLVRSSWLLHVSCNKRRVAPIAALLSSVLHDSVFGNMDMHELDNTP
ncbi:hypothetical protein Tco_0304853 [Tanacetum coccineum]